MHHIDNSVNERASNLKKNLAILREEIENCSILSEENVARLSEEACILQNLLHHLVYPIARLIDQLECGSFVNQIGQSCHTGKYSITFYDADEFAEFIGAQIRLINISYERIINIHESWSNWSYDCEAEDNKKEIETEEIKSKKAIKSKEAEERTKTNRISQEAHNCYNTINNLYIKKPVFTPPILLPKEDVLEKNKTKIKTKTKPKKSKIKKKNPKTTTCFSCGFNFFSRKKDDDIDDNNIGDNKNYRNNNGNRNLSSTS
jgi:hypothetical protein